MPRKLDFDLAYIRDMLVELETKARPFPVVAYLIGVAEAGAREELQNRGAWDGHRGPLH